MLINSLAKADFVVTVLNCSLNNVTEKFFNLFINYASFNVSSVSCKEKI